MESAGLIGRDRESAALRTRLGSRRLVTIVGVGGVGKTSLARTVVADDPNAATGWVDLTRVTDPSAVGGTFASHLGVDSFDGVLAAFAGRDATIVVDNCEHVLDAAADAIGALLGACAGTTVLATSRSPIGLPGESVMAIAPLGLPGDSEPDDLGPAVELFTRCCTDAGVDVGPDDLAAVVDLCRRLDGLPLAIEIAAARTRYLGVAAVADRLTGGIETLERPRFRGDPRHRDVAQAIRWSYDLLSPDAATAFRRLSVFAGPWTADEAASVAGVEPFEAALLELVDASLVSVTAAADDDRPRYRLLEVVRAVASIELGTGDERSDTFDRFVDRVVESTAELLRGSGARWRPGLVADLLDGYDQLAAAIGWCLEHDADPGRLYRLCAPLWAIAHQARASDVVVLMRRVVERSADHESHGAARAVAVLASAEYVTGHPERASSLASDVLATRDRQDAATVTLCRVLGQSLNALGDTAAARAALRRGADLGHEIGVTSMALELDVAEALVMVNDPELVAAAIERVEQAERRAREIDSPVMASWARAVRCWFGVLDEPADVLDEAIDALTEARELRYPIAIAADLRALAYARVLTGRYDEAVDALTQLLDDLLGRGALSNLRLLVDATAALAHRVGHDEWEVLAATARSLPITTMVSAHVDPAGVPVTTAAPLARHRIVGRVRSVLDELREPLETGAAHDSGGAAPARDVAARRRAATIRRADRSVEIELAGHRVSVRTSKGVDDILRLVAAGGRELSALDLADAGVEQSSTGDVIDADARRSYERRIRELQEEIDEAEAFNDFGRSYRLQTELDQIVDHLTAAVRRGGRTRQMGGDAERARSAVTHRIRAAIRQLRRADDLIGRHFDNSIRTGFQCRYEPEQPVAWEFLDP